MADYIDKDILCQAYVHINPVPIGEDALAEFKSQIEDFIESRGRFFIYDEVDTNVELKEGSLKVYATILGAIYIAIGQYGSFRSGVNYLASDVKRLSDTIVSESLFLTKSKHDSIIRAEARIGVVGTLKNIVDELDYIKSLVGEADPHTLAKRMDDLRASIIRMSANLHDPNDEAYIKTNLKDLVIEGIPARPLPSPRKPLEEESKQSYIHERKRLLKELRM